MAVKQNRQVDFQSIPILGTVLENLASAPGSPVAGRAYWDTALGYARIYTGSAWLKMAIPGTGLVDADIASGAAIAETKLSLASDAAAGTASRRTLGTGATQAMPGNTTLSSIAAPTASVNLNNQKIISLLDPTSAQDAATRNYVDTQIAASRTGITGVKDPVKVALLSNVTLSAPGATLDGQSMSAGDRFLAGGQSTGTENGIYVWNGAAVPATRATDADSTGEVADGTFLAVALGTYAGNTLIQTATATGAPGTWTQSWVVFNTSGTTYSAGTGLTLTGSTFSLTTPVSVANGGTGATTAAGARSNLGAPGIARGTWPTSTVAANASGNFTHNLGLPSPFLPAAVAVYDSANSNHPVDVDYTPVDLNTISIGPVGVGVTAGTYNVVVVG